MSASSYLPGRSSSEYCHRYESLRPCSRWERVVSSRFDTDETCQFTGDCIVIVVIIFVIQLNYCSTLRCHSLRFTPVKLPFVLLRATSSFAASLLTLRKICLGNSFFSACRSLRFRCRSLRHSLIRAGALRASAPYGISARKSPRPISNARLHLLPNFYLHPINHMICMGTY